MAGRVGTITGVSPSDELLRPALELAFAVALAGTKLRPPIAPPPQLRPYLKFQKLPGGALPVVRKVVDDDDEFRLRIASVANDELAGELGVLWLTRADGWVERMQELVEAELLAEPDRRAEAIARRADRRREAAEHAANRASAEIAALRADAERERERRHEAERRAAKLEAELVEQRRVVEQTSAEAKATKAKGSSAIAAADEIRQSNQNLRTRVAELEAALDTALAARIDAEAERDDLLAGGPPPGQRTVSAPSPELGRAAGALQDAAAAIRQLAGALDATGAALAPDDGDVNFRTALHAHLPGHHRADHLRRSKAEPLVRRSPMAIPGGLFGNSEAAAAHLVKQAGVVLLVDGYNVAKLGWPTLTLEQQRESMLDALETLVRRSGVRTMVVFDGADLPSPAARRRLLRVRFSPAGVTADDSIRQYVGELPPNRPIVVATNDQAIVRDVRSQGANVITSDQLVALIRR